MKALRLLPNHWKRIGAVLSLAGFGLGVVNIFGNFQIPGFGLKLRAEDHLLQPAFENFTNELALTLLIAGLLMIAYSREKTEDERVQMIRLEAFQWSILVNFVIILITNWVCYMDAFWIVLLCNLFTPLVVFLVRFHYIMYRSEKELGDEIPETI